MTSPKLDPNKLTPEQQVQLQLRTLGAMHAIGTILGARVILLLAVIIDAGLAFMVHDQFSAGVFAGWTGVVLPLLTFLDWNARRGA